MSVSFVGGPADGHELHPQRAPLHVRVVVDEREQRPLDGTVKRDALDILDLLDDEPREHESVHIYRAKWVGSPMHWCGTDGNGRHIGGWTVSGLYHHLPDVDGEQLRDTAAWRQWATSAAHDYYGVPELAAKRRAGKGTIA